MLSRQGVAADFDDALVGSFHVPASTVMAQRALHEFVEGDAVRPAARLAMPRNSSSLVHCMTSIARAPAP